MKRKVKKKVKIFFLLVSLILTIMVCLNFFVFNNETNILTNNENIIKEEVLEHDLTDIDSSFLDYVITNYDNSISLINNYLDENEYSDEMWREITGKSYNLLIDEFSGIIYKTTTENDITFVGDTAFADNYYAMQGINERGIGLEGIIDTEVIDYLNESGLAIANSEFVLGTGNTPMNGKAYTFYGQPDNAKYFTELGVDLVTLANNHVYDYGYDDFITTLETFDSIGIDRIGAGVNEQEASESISYNINGYKVTFVNANRSEKYILTPEAKEDSPGVFRCYNPDGFIDLISIAKESSDIVIALIHWGLEYSHEIEEVLLETGKLYIDAGADAIVGHHAHVLQGIEMYDNKPIIYNIGNFMFNNKDLETAIINFNVNDDMSMSYQFLPAKQSNIYTEFLYGEDAITLINKVESWSINTLIDDEGYIKSIN